MREYEAFDILRDAWIQAVLRSEQDKDGHRFREIAEAYKIGMDAVIEKAEGTLVKVVRCENCTMHNDCKFEQYQGLNGFCSLGERKENDI